MNQSFYQINGENVTIFFRKISTILIIFVFSEEKHELLYCIQYIVLYWYLLRLDLFPLPREFSTCI